MLKSLNEITENEVAEVKRLGGLAYTPREVAIMLELDIQDFIFACDNENAEVYKAYHGGRLQSSIELREKIFLLANSGSSPAQTMALDLFKKQEANSLDR